jgi:hypothetical protein
MKGLPRFRPMGRGQVLKIVNEVLANKRVSENTHLVELVEYPDGHYRALFDCAYFALESGRDAPSKSQWNTLKKKLKRHHPDVFVLKDHGEVECQSRICCYVEFGFYAGT